MENSACLVILIVSCISSSNAANILAILPTISPSHHIWTTPLVVTLANRGHNVTVLSPEAQKKPVPNLTDLVMEGLYEAMDEEYDYEEMADIYLLQWIPILYEFMGKNCELAVQSNSFKQLMNYPPEMKFDLIILESIGVECLLSIIPKFGNPPIVIINGFSVPTWLLEMTGTPNTVSHMPYFLLPFTDHMTFTQRVQNVINNAYNYYLYNYHYLPEMNNLAVTYSGSQAPNAKEIMRSPTIAMANFHPALDYPWAMTPNLIPVGGMQIGEAKPLPQDLQKFLDDAKDGAIFFSLGSNVKSDKLSPEKRKVLLDAFAEIPQKVLWKFESDLPELPKNVKIGKWLPQSDILAHPNVKVFITHSGLLSTHEAVHRGVPVIGIPFLADQHINIQKMIHHGTGVRVEYRDLTKDRLLKAIRTVIENPSYGENMKVLSARFRDNPQSPLERAVFWTEYALRHKGAPHLRSAALDLNFVQYFLLDVIAFFLAVPIILIVLLYFICCKKQSHNRTKEKKS